MTTHYNKLYDAPAYGLPEAASYLKVPYTTLRYWLTGFSKQLPIIVLTAKGDEDNEVRVLESGADDFLTKPFRARALSARIQAVLNRRRP